MSQPSSLSQLSLDKRFRTQWILGNAISHGVGLSFPILWGELTSAPNIPFYVGIAFLSFGLWTGLAQWLLLRQAMLMSSRWAIAVALSPLLSITIALLLSVVSPNSALTLFVFYPILLSLTQWRLLRRVLQPAWRWLIVSLIAITVAAIFGFLFGLVISNIFNLRLGLCVLIGGLGYGSIYGSITYIGLQDLAHMGCTVPNSKSASGQDSPPDDKPWKAAVLQTVAFALLLAVWISVLPSPSASAKTASQSFSVWFTPLLLPAIALAYCYLAILVHELGHLLFALLQGFELRAFSVGRCVMVRGGKRWRIARTRKQFAGGFVEPIHNSLQAVDRQSIMVMIAGGPVASFFLFCVGAVMPLFFPALVSSNALVLYLVILSSISLYMAIFNALPLKIGYLRTDGRRFLDLAKNNMQGQRFTALYGFNASLRQGIRPRDLNPMLVEQALSIPEESADHISGLMIAYSVALDQGKLKLAGDYLDQALAINMHFPELFRGTILLEGAYFEAYIRHQSELARRWFAQIPETVMISPYALLRAEAAVLLEEGHLDAALEKANQGMVSIERDRFMKGSAIADEERLTTLIQSIREAA